jgi:hypothetical protein
VASSEAGRLLTIQHRQQQLALRAATLRDVMRLWPLFTDLSRSGYERFAQTAATLTRDRFNTSAGLAVSYYQGLRVAEKARGPAAPLLAEMPAVEKVMGNLVMTGFVGTMKGLGAGFSPQAAKQNGLVQVMGSVGRQVLRGAAETMVLTSAEDRASTGWQRVTGGGCSFCEMLAGRTFTSEDAASFESHDHCACTAEPTF